ncbi:MAG: hypothetical protein A2Z83_07175 [Omnitrophica bacterium GWA2_52_8]|nr:MAG: hypothetical protein A2Z83_07175 [Omnitrophica bacterium GWA2_52_8]
MIIRRYHGGFCFAVLVTVMSFLGSQGPAKAETSYFGPIVTGLLELPGYGYPVYLFIPDNYDPVREYPLMISIPDEGETAEENIQRWIGLAKRRSLIVMAPTNLRPQDTPKKMDEWVLKIKKDVAQRYHVSGKRIYLVGFKDGAHYAAYLATNYPQEFTAVGLLKGSWVGRFQSLLQEKKASSDQVPFFLALKDETNDFMNQTREVARRYEEKGYLVFLRPLEDDKELDELEFKNEMLQWLDQKSQAWDDEIAVEKGTFKGKFHEWVHRQFKM